MKTIIIGVLCLVLAAAALGAGLAFLEYIWEVFLDFLFKVFDKANLKIRCLTKAKEKRKKRQKSKNVPIQKEQRGWDPENPIVHKGLSEEGYAYVGEHEDEIRASIWEARGCNEFQAAMDELFADDDFLYGNADDENAEQEEISNDEDVAVDEDDESENLDDVQKNILNLYK